VLIVLVCKSAAGVKCKLQQVILEKRTIAKNLNGENEIERMSELKCKIPAEKRTNKSFICFFTHTMSEK
jgi:hypothetical protein